MNINELDSYTRTHMAGWRYAFGNSLETHGQFLSSRDSGGAWNRASLSRDEAVSPSLLMIQVDKVPLEDGNIIRPRKRPLVFHFSPSESKPYYELEDEDLGLSVYADRIEDLKTIAHEQIAILWGEFALKEDAKMTPQARKLKARLLETFESDE